MTVMAITTFLQSISVAFSSKLIVCSIKGLADGPVKLSINLYGIANGHSDIKILYFSNQYLPDSSREHNVVIPIFPSIAATLFRARDDIRVASNNYS